MKYYFKLSLQVVLVLHPFQLSVFAATTRMATRKIVKWFLCTPYAIYLSFAKLFSFMKSVWELLM